MLKVNRKVEYGLVALRHMHSKSEGNLTSVREICDQFGTPFDPLAHVLRILNARGILKSEQGAHGGYRLMESLDNVNLADFIEMIEGRLAWTDCSRGEGECKCGLLDSCNIIDPMHQFNRRLIEFLKSVSLADLLELNGKLLNISLIPTDGDGAVRQPQ